MKRLVKIAGLSMVSFLAIIIVIIVLIAVGVLNKPISSIITRVANQQLNGQLAIERIEGSLLSHFIIRDITVQQDKKTVLSLNELEVDLNIWKVISKKIHIDRLRLENLKATLTEEPDSGWNLLQLLPQSSDTSKVSKPFSWTIELEDLQIIGLEAEIESLDTSIGIPQLIQLNAALEIVYGPEMIKIFSSHIDLNAEDPSFEMKSLTFQAEVIESVLTWQDLEIRLVNTNINSGGSLPFNNPYYADFNFTATPFDLEDFKPWVTGIYGKPEVNIEMRQHDNQNEIEVVVKEKSQSLNLKGKLIDLDDVPGFNFVMKTDSIDGQHWTHLPEFKSNIHGNMEIKGRGFDLRENEATIYAQFGDIKYDDYELNDFLLSVEKRKDSFQGSMVTTSIFGDINSEFEIEKLFESPIYNADIFLRNFNLAILMQDDRLKSRLNLQLKASGEGLDPGNSKLNVGLNSYNSFLLGQPVSELRADLSINNKDYEIDRIIFSTPYLQTFIAGKGNMKESNKLEFKLKADNIEDLVEIAGLDPMQFSGEVQGSLEGSVNALNLQADIDIDKFIIDSLAINGAVAHVEAIFSLPAKNEQDPKHLLKTLQLNTETYIDYATYGNYYLEDLKLDLEKENAKVEGLMESNTIAGHLFSHFSIDKMFLQAEYELKLNLQELDLSKITRIDTLSSDINLEITAAGKGTDQNKLSSNLTIESSESTISGLPIENFKAELDYDGGDYLIQGLNIETPFLNIKADGQGNWIQNNRFNLDIEVGEVETIAELLGFNDFYVLGSMENHISGPADSIRLTSILSLKDLNFDTLSAERIDANIDLQSVHGKLAGTLALDINEIMIQDYAIKNLTFNSTLKDDKANNKLEVFASDSLYGEVLSTLDYHKDPVLFIPDIRMNILNKEWEGGCSATRLVFAKDSIEVHQFEILSGESAVRAHGVISLSGNEGMHLEVKNLDLDRISRLNILPYSFSGDLDTELDITLNANKPLLRASLSIDELAIDTLQLSRLFTSLNYADSHLDAKLLLDDQTSKLIDMDMQLPVNISLSDMKFALQQDKPVNAKFMINKLNLDQWIAFVPLEGISASGLLTTDFTLSNTLEDPILTGKIDLKEGVFKYPEYGIDYRKIEIGNRLDKDHYWVDSIYVSSEKGTMLIKGTADIQSWIAGDLKAIDLDITSQNFNAMNSEAITAFINTDLKINGPIEKPVLKGKVTVLHSAINTDILLKEFNTVSDNKDQPLLVQAKLETKQVNKIKQSTIDTTKKPLPDIYKNLSGEFDIEIPRNTWVKGKNVNFEIEGDLKVIKSGEQLDLFGDVSVKRGFYKIYGKRLEIEEGVVTFTGGKIEDPLLNFNIEYKFRDTERELRKLNVYVSNRVSQPDLSYKIDGRPITEKEALSYIIFNKDPNQLDTRENSSVSHSNLDMTKGLALGLVSNVLQESLGSVFGLDVIEIKGENNWNQASASIGKYLSNNLYLGYEYTFSLNKKDKVVDPYKVSLEYQILRWLFLQGTNQSSNSGFDFVLRWDID